MDIFTLDLGIARMGITRMDGKYPNQKSEKSKPEVGSSCSSSLDNLDFTISLCAFCVHKTIYRYCTQHVNTEAGDVYHKVMCHDAHQSK